MQDQSELYAYEIVNFVDGKRTVGDIRDAVSAEYGPLPIDLVTDYLEACVEAKVIQWKHQDLSRNILHKVLTTEVTEDTEEP